MLSHFHQSKISFPETVLLVSAMDSCISAISCYFTAVLLIGKVSLRIVQGHIHFLTEVWVCSANGYS